MGVVCRRKYAVHTETGMSSPFLLKAKPFGNTQQCKPAAERTQLKHHNNENLPAWYPVSLAK